MIEIAYKKRILKILTIVLIAVCSLILTACIPDEATDELIENTSRECIPKAEAWFENNLPEADVTSIRLLSDNYYCSRSVEGTYSIDGQEHNFMYNCDKNEMLSTKGMNITKEYVAECICKITGISDYSGFEVNNLGFTYSVTYLEDRKNGWDPDEQAKTEISEYDVGVSLHYLPIDADEETIEKMTLKRLKSKHPLEKLRIDFAYEGEFEELSEDTVLNLYKEYPGIDTVRLYYESEPGEYISAEYKNPGEDVLKKGPQDVVDMVKEYQNKEN